MSFHEGIIEGIQVRQLKVHHDERGWLAEIYRDDQIDLAIRPAMAYISLTQPGLARGPHAHRDQTDCFAFPGPSVYRITLWDNRRESPTYETMMTITAGEGNPLVLVVPPGVVHAYKNIGNVPGPVLNLPNRLYAGPGGREDADEIRYESMEDSPFLIQ